MQRTDPIPENAHETPESADRDQTARESERTRIDTPTGIDADAARSDSEPDRSDSEFTRSDTEYARSDSEFDRSDAEFAGSDSERARSDSEFAPSGGFTRSSTDEDTPTATGTAPVVTPPATSTSDPAAGTTYPSDRSTDRDRSDQFDPVHASDRSGSTSHRADAGATEGGKHVLDDTLTTKYRDRWREVQATFVDDPAGAVHSADELVMEVTSAVSKAISARREALGTGEGSESETEQLRTTLRSYRVIVDHLLEV